MNFVKTTDPDFVKDDQSGSVINTNANAYRAYKRNRNNENMIENLNTRVVFLEKELSQLKYKINEILKGNHGNFDS